ncbi:SPOR domain-containing protein [Roseobacter sinensis]|uniref:SPOR domain-containing protein n=1 Tax=Roseobacter sinensis TaxID=2931391 RepID=A0ABT3BFI8_9RHOB|nr:SPOR domain-containing protein [Roseobacter sp. WL0113]MCV3272346.1 SPOR domain-containing protein [Roseobacter sp. WL0113]
MADIEFSHGMGAYGREPAPDRADEPTPNTFVMMTNVAGAVVSLALIAGIGVWGYKLMVRDVSGIPVVRAAEGEMRVRPENPGGQLARHQGLAVNAVAAEGSAAGPVDQVVLAPRDTDLAEEDQPITAETVAPVAQPEPLAPAAESLDGPKRVPARTDSTVAENLHAGAIDAVVAELTAGSTPLGDAEAEESQPPAAFAETSEDEAAETPPVIGQTVKRPQLRPRAVARMQPAAFVSETPTSEVEAAAIPSGTRLVQLGAFDSADVARSEWSRLEGRFGEYMQDKSRVVQQTESGGRTFYRLRAMGFRDLADARRFCSAFKAEGVDCIPVAAK